MQHQDDQKPAAAAKHTVKLESGSAAPQKKPKLESAVQKKHLPQSAIGGGVEADVKPDNNSDKKPEIKPELKPKVNQEKASLKSEPRLAKLEPGVVVRRIHKFQTNLSTERRPTFGFANSGTDKQEPLFGAGQVPKTEKNNNKSKSNFSSQNWSKSQTDQQQHNFDKACTTFTRWREPQSHTERPEMRPQPRPPVPRFIDRQLPHNFDPLAADHKLDLDPMDSTDPRNASNYYDYLHRLKRATDPEWRNFTWDASAWRPEAQ